MTEQQLRLDLPEPAPAWLEDLLLTFDAPDLGDLPQSLPDDPDMPRHHKYLAITQPTPPTTSRPEGQENDLASLSTPAKIARATLIAEAVSAGLTHKQIGEQLGLSGPRITQVITREIPILRHHPEAPASLRDFRPHPRALIQYRNTLWTMRHELAGIQGEIRKELQTIDEELQAYQIDQLLGLRP